MQCKHFVNIYNVVLFGGMLNINTYSIYFDVLYLLIGLLTLVFSKGSNPQTDKTKSTTNIDNKE